METWLTCDKTLLLDQALRDYQLCWRDVLAYAFLQTPAKNCRRARISRGPTRYSKYEIRLFLMTRNGVREVSTELDFEAGAMHGQDHHEFSFESICSVHVSQPDDTQYTLELTLVNGSTRAIRVKDREPVQVAVDENPADLARLELDAAGFTHARHLLEGIAADGTRWIDRAPDTPTTGLGDRT